MYNLPTSSRHTWSFYSWTYMNSTKCKISQPVHVSHDLTSAENTRIAHNVKSPNLHTSQNIFLQLKMHVHDRSTSENTWISTQSKFSHRVLYYRSSTYKSPQMSTFIHGKYRIKIIFTYLQDLWLRNTQKEHNIKNQSVSMIALCQNTRKPHIVNSPDISIFCDFKLP